MKLFISYRWSSPRHEEWVLNLASSLRSDGVEVILDKWHLREGQDTLAFMEQTVNDPDVHKVLLICDSGYVDRANSRKGGVGTEAQIISPDVYSKSDQTKFAAAVTELDSEGKAILPTYMTGRLYFDFSTEDVYPFSYEKVLRWCFDKPFHVAPPVGAPPKLLDSLYTPNPTFTINSANLRRLRTSGTPEAIISSARQILLEIGSKSSSFCLQLLNVNPPDEMVVEAIKEADQVREQAYQALDVLVQSFSSTPKVAQWIHSLLEEISSYWDFGPDQGAYTQLDNDALRYFAHSLLVGFVSLCLQHREYALIDEVLSVPFYRPTRSGRLGTGADYGTLRPYLRSLEEFRKHRLGLNRISLHADYLHDSHQSSTVKFASFMEADFVLYLRHLISREGIRRYPDWYPISLVYATHAHGSFPTFTRASSKRVYEKVSSAIGSLSADKLREMLSPYVLGEKKTIQYDYWPLDIAELSNLKNLGTTD